MTDTRRSTFEVEIEADDVNDLRAAARACGSSGPFRMLERDARFFLFSEGWAGLDPGEGGRVIAEAREQLGLLNGILALLEPTALPVRMGTVLFVNKYGQRDDGIVRWVRRGPEL